MISRGGVLILEGPQQPEKRKDRKRDLKRGWDLTRQGERRTLPRVRFSWPGRDAEPVCVCSSSSAPPAEVTYGMVAADLLHALLAGGGAPCVVKVQSLFLLDENSYPLQQDFSLLDFYPDNVSPPPRPSLRPGEKIAGASRTIPEMVRLLK